LSLLRQGVTGHAGFAQHSALVAPMGARPFAITASSISVSVAHTALSVAVNALGAGSARRCDQPGPIDAAIFAHQVRTTPDNRLAILVTRGNEDSPTKGRRPGRAESLRLQERSADERGVDRAE
jgi:hypothetical protein